MNICYVCDGYPPERKVGGIERFTQTLARELALRGHQISVVGYSNGSNRISVDDDRGVRVVRLPRNKHGLLPPAISDRLLLERMIRQECNQFAIQLVESHDVRGPLLTGFLGAPLIIRLHGAQIVHSKLKGEAPQRFTTFFEKHNIKLANHLVAVSKFIRDETLKEAGLKDRKCEVIYNGVDTNFFSPGPISIQRIRSHTVCWSSFQSKRGAKFVQSFTKSIRCYS